MTSLSHIKRYVWPIAIALVISITVIVLHSRTSPPPVMVGEYTMPEIEGWRREVKVSSEGPTVFYDNHGVHLSFHQDVGMKEPHRTYTDLEALDQVAMQKFNTVAATRPTIAGRAKGQVKETLCDPAPFNGMPALLTEKRYAGLISSTTKTLEFIKGDSVYTLHSYIFTSRDDQVSPERKALREEAWKKLTDSFTVTP